MTELNQNVRQEIVKKLLKNEVLILPTDTIYGLSLIMKNNQPTVLNSLKKADLNKPVIVLVANFNQVKNLVKSDEETLKILNNPNPTTVIFPLKDSSETLGIRICQRPDLQEILLETGPIYSTSVNISHELPLTKQTELVDFLKQPENVFWVGPLNNPASKIYNSITKKWVR